MNLADVRDRVRQVFGAELVDACRVLRHDPVPVDEPVDPETFELDEVERPEDEVYAGPCLVTSPFFYRTHDQEGEGVVIHRAWQVLIPHTAPAFFERDVVVVTASENAELLESVTGLRLSVTGVHRSSHAPFRVLDVEDERGALSRG